MKWIVEKFESFGGRVAVIDNDIEYSYQKLFDKLKYYTDLFHGEIGTGQSVAYVGKYCFESIAIFFGLYETNQIISLIGADDAELNKKLEIFQPNFIITLNKGLAEIRKNKLTTTDKLIQSFKNAGHIGLVIFTSGTTGIPKAILHNLDLLINSYKRDYTKDLNIIPLLGFDHIGGFDMMMSQLTIGATLTIADNRTPEKICETIERHHVNIISASPTFFNLLLLSEVYKSYDLRSLQMIGYGSEPMPEWILQKLTEAFPRVQFQQKYGLSETNAIRIKSKASESLFFKIDDPTVEYKIVDNELYLRCPSVFAGYLGQTNAPPPIGRLV